MAGETMKFKEIYKRRKKSLMDLALKKRIGEIPEALDGRLKIKQYEEPLKDGLKSFVEYYELDNTPLIQFVFEGKKVPGNKMILEFKTIFYNDDGSENSIASEPVLNSEMVI